MGEKKKIQEKVIQKACLEVLKKAGWYSFKVIAANKAGVPDIIACSPKGEFYAFEIKTLTGKTTKLQQYNLQKIRENKGKAFVIRSPKELEEIIKKEGAQF